MEWQIMNGVGLNSSISGFGCLVDEQYQIYDDCLDNLTMVLEHLADDDPIQRPVRRQLASSRAIEQELVPLLIGVQDDPTVFNVAVRLCVHLTQPVECLHYVGTEQGASSSSWYFDVQKLLTDAKRAFTNIKCIQTIFSEIKKIFEDAGEYDLVQDDCDMINQCLLLIRNLLHIQDSQQASLSDTHIIFLNYLFQAGIDEVMLTLLNSKQKEQWGVTVVQLISLLYKDLVSEIFLMFEDVSSCGEESCDSSNCSQCEAAMDRFPMEPRYTASDSKPGSPPCSKCNSPLGFTQKDDTTLTQNSFNENNAIITPIPQSSRKSAGSCSPPCTDFEDICKVTSDIYEHDQCNGCSATRRDTAEEKKASPVDHSHSSQSLSDRMTVNPQTTPTSPHLMSVEQLGSCLTDFTTHFLQNGFSSLVHVLKQTLVTNNSNNPPLDDSYFLWSVAFFLKFARRNEIGFGKIKEVFTTDVFGFLVYEAVLNSEEVIRLYSNDQPVSLSMRRLHLSISAIRELLKTLTFHKERGLSTEDHAYLMALQQDLANMSDLQQMFLWLIRMYTPGCHSNLFLRDVIVTNHYFLLLLEEWISKDFCSNSLTMLSHVKQFATGQVMQQYSLLLENFVKNDHHVNNCVFTMMHHVAGDCAHPETLLQVGILKTFLQIWDAEIPITQEMNDLMEYVIQKFLKTAEDNPVSCAVQLFMGEQDQDVPFKDETETVIDNEWTSEEEDKLILWYSQLENSTHMVTKLVQKFVDNGMKKSKLEIVNQLFQLGMLSEEELVAFLNDKDLASLKLEPEQVQVDEQATERNLILEELSKMKEENFLVYCLKNINVEGLGDQLKFIQKTLLEAAYVRIDGTYIKKDHVEEPVAKYFNMKGKPMPIVFYSEVQEKIRENIYMGALMRYLGLTWDDTCPLMYPKIPCEFTVHDLVAKAKLLGDVSEVIKFDLESVPIEKERMTSLKEKMTIVDSCPKENNSQRCQLAKMVPAAGWMNIVHQFNMATSQGEGETTLVGVTGKCRNMDLE